MSGSHSTGIPDRVNQLYYAHGVICASHPVRLVVVAIAIVLLCCYPLFNIPVPWHLPKDKSVPLADFQSSFEDGDEQHNIFGPNASYPEWYRDGMEPLAYIQQIIVRASISAWSNESVLMDAFRGPLSLAFDISGTIADFHAEDGTSLRDLCFHVEEPVAPLTPNLTELLPHFNCLMLSPASSWNQGMENFLADPNILNTIYAQHGMGKLGVSLAELFFGIPMKETGLKRFPNQARRRMITFAVSVLFSKYEPQYLSGLKEKLYQKYPPLSFGVNGTHQQDVVHRFYVANSGFMYAVPISLTYLGVFCYIYFNVHKIEQLRSKFGMAFSALITVILSLCMSVGICAHLGLRFVWTGYEFFPYAIVLIGLENILVLTRSVVSASASHLDVKIRIAKGLNKEGWSITKNLLTEISLLTIGFFTFVPAIQSFCLLVLAGILSDFFLQMTFFAPILSIDLRRMEAFVAARPTTANSRSSQPSDISVFRSRYPSYVVAPSYAATGPFELPRRLRVVFFWAQWRVFQRCLIGFMLIWFSLVLYRVLIIGMLGSLLNFPVENSTNATEPVTPVLQPPDLAVTTNRSVVPVVAKASTEPAKQGDSSPPAPVEMAEFDEKFYSKDSALSAWKRLPPGHWKTLFEVYGVSVWDKFITVLPPVFLTATISPSDVVRIRHSKDVEISKNLLSGTWSAIGLDSADVPVGVRSMPKGLEDLPSGFDSSGWGVDESGYVPQSPLEVLYTVLLAVPTLLFMSYLAVVLYRCICTRHYAEWRSTSWWGAQRDPEGPIEDDGAQVFMEAVPLVLSGHSQEIECLGVNKNRIFSVCLSGSLRVWDPNTGQCVKCIERKKLFHSENGDSEAGSRQKSETNDAQYDATNANGIGRYLELDLLDDANSDYGSGGSPHSNGEPSLYERFWRSGNKRLSVPAHLSGFDFSTASTSTRFRFGDAAPCSDIDGRVCAVSCPGSNCPKRTTSCQESGDHVGKSTGSVVRTHRRIRSTGGADYFSSFTPCLEASTTTSSTDSKHSPHDIVCLERDRTASCVWSLSVLGDYVALGCSSGAIEIWDVRTGNLRSYLLPPGNSQNEAVTALSLVRSDCPVGVGEAEDDSVVLVVARLSGKVSFHALRKAAQRTSPCPPSSHNVVAQNHVRTRGHARSCSVGGEYLEFSGQNPAVYSARTSVGGDLCLVLYSEVPAHQQPISVFVCEGGRVVTGGQDHVVKVLKVDKGIGLFTFHGHYGPITAMFVDAAAPDSACTASQDGMLCMWDLSNGLCVYNVQAHDGIIASMTYTSSYIVTYGGDDSLRIWERFQGYLLHSIQLDSSYSGSMIMLTNKLLVTARKGSLVIWDVTLGQAVRIIRLGDGDERVSVRQIASVECGLLVCDYGNQLRALRFPTVYKQKSE